MQAVSSKSIWFVVETVVFLKLDRSGANYLRDNHNEGENCSY